ncbi:MAG: hypothetical protein CMJ59_15620 [Planctomycetaceae bacterium]|nr:hypothetical protein [Planctomycetaceae bacterium]
MADSLHTHVNGGKLRPSGRANESGEQVLTNADCAPTHEPDSNHRREPADGDSATTGTVNAYRQANSNQPLRNRPPHVIPDLREPPALPDQSTSAEHVPRGQQQKTLVELQIVLGRTQMPVADVMRLETGSVIALDCLTSEPVEVLVNRQLVARGEVCVLDRRFCVRITERIFQRHLATTLPNQDR